MQTVLGRSVGLGGGLGARFRIGVPKGSGFSVSEIYKFLYIEISTSGFSAGFSLSIVLPTYA
jgi:hypothetical protein